MAGRQIEPHADRARCRRVRARLRAAGGGGAEEVLHGGGDRGRPRFPVLRRETIAGAHRLSRQGFRRRDRTCQRHTSPPGPRPLSRATHQGHEARARPGGALRRGARADQPGAHLRQRRRLRQRPQFHAQHGLRHLGRQFHHRQPELHELSQHHPPRHHHPRRQAERGAAVRRLLDEIRRESADEFRGTCRESADPGACRHCECRAAMLCTDRSRGGQGGRADRPLRGQGAGADRQTRQGRRHQARQHAQRGRAGRGPNPRHAHRRLYRRAPADRGAGEDRTRVLCRGAARHVGAQTADFVFDRRRHGHRGDRRRKAASDPALVGRYRRHALGCRHRRHVEGPRSRHRARADRRHPGASLRRLSRARRRAVGDQPAGAAGRWPRGGARLQIRARRCRRLSPAGDRQATARPAP